MIFTLLPGGGGGGGGSGDLYDRLIELPTFAHSDNHAGLQVADAMCSALLTPIAVNTYCAGPKRACASALFSLQNELRRPHKGRATSLPRS